MNNQQIETAGTDPLDPILDRMMQTESGGNPNARGRAGELGLFQIKPQTAMQYGIRDPSQLFNPQINRSVAKSYLTDLLKRYGGNMQLALTAYNAGPAMADKGITPPSTRSYLSKILGSLSSSSAEAAEPSEYTGPLVPRGGSATGGASTEYTGPLTPRTAPPSQPWPVRAAGWLPMVGQFGGEALGATAGAAVPGFGETGITEAGGATGGGALGAAGGAEIENQIRKAYGLPPVSVGSEALMGGVTSGLGQALKGVVGIGRALKAGRVAEQTTKDAATAFGEATGRATSLEQKVGMTPGKAGLLKGASAQPLRAAYLDTREAELNALGQQYDQILGKYRFRVIPNPQVRVVMNGPTGRMLDIVGKPLRTAIEGEINRAPLTVSRARIVLSTLRQFKRGMNPEKDRMALGAIGNLEKALTADIQKAIGPTDAAAVRNVDSYYAQKIAQYPIGAVKRAFNEPQAAEAILASKPGDVQRVVSIINDMKASGKIDTLRRATAARIWQQAGTNVSTNPAERLTGMMKAVGKIDSNVFDALYGSGARDQWLRSTRAVMERNAELLKNPNEAAAVKAAVQDYLKQPGVLAKMGGRFMEHRLMIGGLMAVGGEEFGQHEVAAIGAGLLFLHAYEAAMHSRKGMELLEKAAMSKNTQATARYIVAAVSASLHAGVDDESN